MSNFHSDKCTKEELIIFKAKVINWLDSNFSGWKDKFKIKVFHCYGGDIRLYDGTSQEFPNIKSSFRRGEPGYNKKGEIIGWNGTRGIHSQRVVSYISINKDEFEKLKKSYKDKNGDDWEFFNDLIFRHLIPK